MKEGLLMREHKPSKTLMLIGVGLSLIFGIIAIVNGVMSVINFITVSALNGWDSLYHFGMFLLISFVSYYCFYGFSILVYNAEIDIYDKGYTLSDVNRGFMGEKPNKSKQQ